MSFLLVAMSMFMALYAGFRSILWRRLRLQERVKRVQEAGLPAMRTPTQDAEGLTRAGVAVVAPGVIATLRHQVFRRPLDHVVQTWERLGYKITRRDWTAAGFMALMLAMVGVAMTRSVWGLFITLPISSGLYTTLLLYVRKRRAKHLDAHLCHMLTTLSGALRAGYSFLQSLEMALRDTSGPLSQELDRLLRELSLGVRFDDALAHATRRIESRDFELVANALLVQRQVGGNLAEILDTVCETIRERLRLAGDLRALTAQGRLSMWIFLLLTPGIALMLYIMNPSYISLLGESQLGLIMILLSIAGQVIGALIIRKIVRVTA